MSDEIPGASESEDDAGFDELARRAGAALRRPAPEDGVRAITQRHRRQQALKATVVAGVVVAALIGTLAVAANLNEPDSLTPVDSPPGSLPVTAAPTPTTASTPVVSSPATAAATTTAAPGTGDESTFATAIEASGVLTSPSANDVAQAMNNDVYRRDDWTFDRTQVSATGNSVSLRRCRTPGSATCGTRLAYVTGVAEGAELHGGLLGETSPRDVRLYLLDERYFVALESAPGKQAPSTAWLIDAVSGQAGALSWSDEPTTLNSPEQSLLLCEESHSSFATGCALTLKDAGVLRSDGTTVTEPASVIGLDGDIYLPTEVGLPKVVDARDGTIRPLAMPDNVVAGLPVAQHGTGRIWIGTDPDGDRLGLAYSDDGGATWSQVALPEPLRATDEGFRKGNLYDDFLEIAAHGERVAVARSWGGDDDAVYVSDDSGQSWRTATFERGDNGVHLYVLADGRLVVMGSLDVYARELLVSSGSHWTELEKVDDFVPMYPPSSPQNFSVNRGGIALMRSYVDANGSELDTIEISPDLTNWSTLESLDD